MNINLDGLEGKFSTSREHRCADCGWDHDQDISYEVRWQAPFRQWSILCHRCGKESHNQNDVENHYCGHCHVFHDDCTVPLLLWKGEHRELMLCLCWPCAQKRMKPGIVMAETNIDLPAEPKDAPEP